MNRTDLAFLTTNAAIVGILAWLAWVLLVPFLGIWLVVGGLAVVAVSLAPRFVAIARPRETHSAPTLPHAAEGSVSVVVADGAVSLAESGRVSEILGS